MYRKARPRGEDLVPGIVGTYCLHATGQTIQCVSRSISTCLYTGESRLEAAIRAARERFRLRLVGMDGL